MSGIGSRTRSRTPVDSEEAQDAPPAKSAKTTEVESDVESEVDAVAETPPKIGFRCADTKDPRHLCKSLGRALLDGATPSQGQIQALGHLLYECNENNVDVSGVELLCRLDVDAIKPPPMYAYDAEESAAMVAAMRQLTWASPSPDLRLGTLGEGAYFEAVAAPWFRGGYDGDKKTDVAWAAFLENVENFKAEDQSYDDFWLQCFLSKKNPDDPALRTFLTQIKKATGGVLPGLWDECAEMPNWAKVNREWFDGRRFYSAFDRYIRSEEGLMGETGGVLTARLKWVEFVDDKVTWKVLKAEWDAGRDEAVVWYYDTAKFPGERWPVPAPRTYRHDPSQSYPSKRDPGKLYIELGDCERSSVDEVYDWIRETNSGGAS